MKKFLIILNIILLVGVAVLCFVRWDAWFVNPEEPEWEGDTIDYHFQTFGRDSVPGFSFNGVEWEDTDNPEELRFIILGDVHNSMDSIQWATIAARHPGLDFYAQLGDFMERSYTYYEQQLFQELEGTPFASLPIIATPGNHEYMKGIRRHLPKRWYDLFPNPQNGPERFLGTTYYVDFKGLRFIVIDTNGLQHTSDFTILNTWVKQTLRDAGDRFKVVIMHHPVESSGEGRQNPLIKLTFKRALQRADLVFSGHDHSYARKLPFVGTNSARKFYRTKVNHQFDQLGTDNQYYELVTLRNDTLMMQTYIMDSGELFDEVTLTKHRSDNL